MKSPRAIPLIWFVTLVFCVLLVTDALPWLRGDVLWIPLLGRWRWPYGHPRWAWLVPCALALTLYVGGALALLTRRVTLRYPVRLVLWTFVGAALLWTLLLTLEGSPIFLLFTRAVSPVTGGYQYAAALVTDLDATLRHWSPFVDEYLAIVQLDPPGGVALSPPGVLAVYEANGTLLDAVPPLADHAAALIRPQQCQNLAMMAWTNADLGSAWFQMWMPLWAALGIAPLYRLGTLVFDQTRARLAVAVWPLVPGLAIFMPRFNVFFPLITLIVLVSLWRGLLRDRPRWIAVSGFALSVGLLLNLSLVPLGLLAGLTIMGWHVLPINRQARAFWFTSPPGPLSTRGEGESDVREVPSPYWERGFRGEVNTRRNQNRILLILRPYLSALGKKGVARDLVLFGAGCASSWLIYALLAGLSFGDLLSGFDRHADLYRPYLPWLLLHPYDMFIFVGLPVAAFALWRMIRLHRARRSSITPGDLFTGTAALTLVILVLSGTARGETGRVWLYFAPVWILLAVDVLADFGPRQWAGFLVLQAVCLLSMAGFWRANFTGLTEPPQPAKAASTPVFPAHARFTRGDDAIMLVGLDLDAAPTGITLRLHWRADARVTRPYVLNLLSIPPDGSPPDSLTWNPEGWNYPPACWTPGRAFIDTVPLSLGDTLTPGNWLFSLSIIDAFTGESMTVTLPSGEVSTQFGIGPVLVE